MSSYTQSFLFRQQPSNLARFGLWTGYFFTVNVVVGSGFLTLPYAFSRSGWALALFFMILIAILSFYLARQVLEILARVECMKQLEEVQIFIERPTFRQLIFGGCPKVIIPDEVKLEITDRRFDLSCLAGILLGKNYGIAYMVFLYLFMTGAQVGYGSIFASSFAATVPLGFSDTCNIYEDAEVFGACRVNYWFYLAIYTAFMMYLTIKGLREQVWVQSVLTMMRFLVIGIIVFTCIALISGHSNIKNGDYTPLEIPQAINIETMLSSLPSIFFAFIYQMQFPSIAEFIHDKKRNLHYIILMVGVTTITIYLMIAMLVPIAVHGVKPQCSIEYSNYSAGYSQSERPWWTYIIAFIVVLFPALDVFSSFPLMAVAVSDNLLTMKYGISNEDFVNDKIKRNYRILSVAIPLCISFLLFDLGEIIDWVGISGFILAPVAIPLMHSSAREMLNIPSDYDTPFYSRVTFI